MDQKGFSYIEVLMAAAILSVMMMPIISGFFVAGRNFQYAQDYYRANLEAQNILEEAQSKLWNEKTLSHRGRQDFFQWIRKDSLSKDDFEYVLSLHQILENGKIAEDGCRFESRDGLPMEESVRLRYETPAVLKNTPTLTNQRWDVILTFDGDFTVEKDASGCFIASDGTIGESGADTSESSDFPEGKLYEEATLDFSGREGDQFWILVRLESKEEAAGTLAIVSGGDTGIQIDVMLLPGVRSEVLEIDTTLCEGPYVRFDRVKAPFESYLATAEVYDKNGSLIKRMMRIITVGG